MEQAFCIVQGKVEDDDGNPISNARVYYEKSGTSQPDIAILTDENGRFSLSVQQSDLLLKLGISADNYQTQIVSIKCSNEISRQLIFVLKKE